MRKTFAGLLVTGAMFLGCSGASTATATASPVPPNPNPWVWNLSSGGDGLVINGKANSLAQILTVKDPFGAPIFSVGHVGGAGVYGDRFAVFPPSSVTAPVIVLGDDGRISITGPNAGVWIDGQLLTSADIAKLHSLK